MAIQTPEVNTDNMSLADLKKLAIEEAKREADKEAAKAAGTDPDDVDPNDPADIDPDDETIVYRREIDLGDGSGKQVFEADSLEALVDKLADAQKHATKKIREQQAELGKVAKAKTDADTQAEVDAEYINGQLLQTKPTEAFKKMFKATTGMDISEFKTKLDRVEAFESGQRSQQVQNDFVATHPDYLANPANGKRIAKWCETNGYTEFTAEGLEKAYEDLKESGLLELKDDAEPTEKPVTAKTPVAAKTEPQPEVRTQRRGSSITSRSRTASAVRTEPTEEELYSMPLDKLRNLANAQMKSVQ